MHTIIRMGRKIRANLWYFVFSVLFFLATAAWATGLQSWPSLSWGQDDVSMIGGLSCAALLFVQFFVFSESPPYRKAFHVADFKEEEKGFYVEIASKDHLQGKAPQVTAYNREGVQTGCVITVDPATGDVLVAVSPRPVDGLVVQVG